MNLEIALRYSFFSRVQQTKESGYIYQTTHKTKKKNYYRILPTNTRVPFLDIKKKEKEIKKHVQKAERISECHGWHDGWSN